MPILNQLSMAGKSIAISTDDLSSYTCIVAVSHAVKTYVFYE